MDSSPKRRARFKKGVIPTPVPPPAKSSWFEEYQQRQEQRKRRQEERIRKRKPLPDEFTMLERFVELNLRYFALSDPNFWEDSKTRSFWYHSDFLNAIRLGQHPESSDFIIATCRKAQFPVFRHGTIKVDLPEIKAESRKLNATISYHLAETSEWTDALGDVVAISSVVCLFCFMVGSYPYPG